ncbi:uncharacterized protein EV154DRAFT_525586 [Mucor mucedo]|uniref:uncharacterized protein n=1 Tax=Mucor mucedo TaxID=29922 RepID=UPI00221EAA89|nr:uncharacterized protein EV154DRAFT_525586 [Mucor mucedo]KAI7877081.1 hypothetical protein EV154DRAFT_525586 [Mucor mucedo]
MTQWETIHDHSSHISPVRPARIKDYSTDRGNGIFEAVSKSYIPTASNMSQHHIFVKPTNKHKSTLMRLAVHFLLLSIPVFLFWQYYAQNMTVNTHRLHHVKRTIQSQVTQPFLNAQQASIDMARHFIYTPSRIIHDHYKQTISPIITSNELIIKHYWLLWKQDYDAYVNSKMDYTSTEIILDQSVKKTAEWIREYIQTPREGMRKKDADEKAQQIVKSIVRTTNG